MMYFIGMAFHSPIWPMCVFMLAPLSPFISISKIFRKFFWVARV
ncbi:ORF50 [White spot syndrome virus]|nr:ORF50 [White spot syndrome virus]